jgi:hypothetical protein
MRRLDIQNLFASDIYRFAFKSDLKFVEYIDTVLLDKYIFLQSSIVNYPWIFIFTSLNGINIYCSKFSPSFQHLRLQVKCRELNNKYLRFASENFTAEIFSLNRFRIIETHLYINLLWSVVIFIRYVLRIQYTWVTVLEWMVPIAVVTSLPRLKTSIHLIPLYWCVWSKPGPIQFHSSLLCFSGFWGLPVVHFVAGRYVYFRP